MNDSANGITTQDFTRVAARVSTWRRPVLLTHTNPDGDALGCLVAMRSILRSRGAEPRAMLYEPIPSRYAWLVEGDPLDVLSESLEASAPGIDGILVLDTCSYSQLEPVADWLRRTAVPKVALDHHVTRDCQADEYLIDEGASSACLIVHDWALAVGWPLDEQARLAVYLGIATDTGWFRFANTDARTLEAAAKLTRQGIAPAALFEQLYQHETPARFRMLAAALSTMELHQDGRLAVMTVTAEMFARTKADPQDTEDLINHPLRMGSVDVSVLLVQRDGDLIRTSFRSKPPSAVRPDIDVAAIAATFGGGGHRRAAGARITGTLDEVKARIVAAVQSKPAART